MGDRAIITSTNTDKERAGLYLHWDGRPAFVLALLEAGRKLGIRSPTSDDTYCFGRLAQIYGNCNPGDTGMGAGPITHMDDGDNGIYEVGNDWKIERRSRAGVMTLADLDPAELTDYENSLADLLKANSAIFGKKLAA